MSDLGLTNDSESHKAWMSRRDGDLLEWVIMGAARRASSRPFQVLEWGTGRSTLWFTRLLEQSGIQYLWVTLEYDRRFFQSQIAHELGERRDVIAIRGEDVLAITEHLKDPQRRGIVVLLYDVGPLYPWYLGHEADRFVDLTDYVRMPATLSRQFDIIIVDGRKRRRCLIEARSLVVHDGRVILDDAWRHNYRRAFKFYPWWSRLGDSLWMGATCAPTADELRSLPPDAFRDHREGPRPGSSRSTFLYAASKQAHALFAPRGDGEHRSCSCSPRAKQRRLG